MLQIGDSVLISPYLTMCEAWISGVVIDVENNPFRGIVISAQTTDGNIFLVWKMISNCQLKGLRTIGDLGTL